MLTNAVLLFLRCEKCLSEVCLVSVSVLKGLTSVISSIMLRVGNQTVSNWRESQGGLRKSSHRRCER